MTQHEEKPQDEMDTSQGTDQELLLVTELINEKLIEGLVNDANFAFDADGNVVERCNKSVLSDDKIEVAQNVQDVGSITQMTNPEDTLFEMEPVVIQIEDQEEGNDKAVEVEEIDLTLTSPKQKKKDLLALAVSSIEEPIEGSESNLNEAIINENPTPDMTTPFIDAISNGLMNYSGSIQK